MRIFRFGAQLAGTAIFVVSFFVLPISIALIRQSIEVETRVQPDPGEVRVVQLPAPGGGGDVPDASNEGGDPVETGQDATPESATEVEGAPVGTPVASPSNAPAQGRASQGTGGGRGGGYGAIRMTRPPGHDRPTRGGQSDRSCEPQVAGIVETGTNRYDVDKALIDEYANLRRAQELVGWIDRHRGDDGRLDGVQVGGIRCGSPLHLAGIRSGDVLHSVNGAEVKGIPGALAAARQLRRSDVVEIRLTRDGTTFRVVYRVS